MAAKIDKLKDQAAKLVGQDKIDKAIATYQKVLELDELDLTALQKLADLYAQEDQPEEAIASYTRVAEIFAADGLLLKAIASCKRILEIDEGHTNTQKMLADLYAKKTGRAASVAKAAGREVIAEPEELPAIPLFSDLSKNAFIQLMEQMTMRQALPDEVIIQEGAVGDSMFIISSGQVKVTKATDTGEELVLAHMSDGAFFGEIALLSDTPRTANVIAESETELFQVSRETLSHVVENFPSVKHILMKFHRQRLLANLLATSPFFRPLDEEVRRGIIEKFKSREVPGGQNLVEEGGKPNGLYMVLFGQCEVVKDLGGKRQVVGHLKQGDVFGEMELLSAEPNIGTVKTLRSSIILKMGTRTFAEVAQAHPPVVNYLQEVSQERQQTIAAIAAGKLKFSEDGLVVA